MFIRIYSPYHWGT